MAVLRWLGEKSVPPRTILCTPSKALETWVLVGLFPGDNVVRRRSNIECHENPERILQGKSKKRRLVSRGKKDVDKYQELAPEFADHWSRVRAQCSEAARFENDFRSAVALLSDKERAS
jgi:hypothetical protein